MLQRFSLERHKVNDSDFFKCLLQVWDAWAERIRRNALQTQLQVLRHLQVDGPHQQQPQVDVGVLSSQLMRGSAELECSHKFSFSSYSSGDYISED